MRSLWKALICAALFASTARAEVNEEEVESALALQVGIGTDSSKMIGIAFSRPIFTKWIVYEIAGGSYNTETGVFGSAGIGAEIKSDNGIYARLVPGIAVITNPDENIDGYLQFRTAVGLGYSGNVGRVGLFYQLLSNGGVSDGYGHFGLEAAWYF